jgi:hypothetical protein
MSPTKRQYETSEQSNVTDASWRMDIQTACDIIIGDGLDLEQAYTDNDPDFFIKNGVKKLGVARRFIRDIPKFAKRQKQSHDAELE